MTMAAAPLIVASDESIAAETLIKLWASEWSIANN